MQTISKALVGVVLACLLLSCASGAQRPIRCTHSKNRNGHGSHRVLARLRRCRGDNPVHHPVRPCKNATLPPDEDDDDREHPLAKVSHERLLSLYQDPKLLTFSLAFGSRPLPTEVPRHQTLCILLI